MKYSLIWRLLKENKIYFIIVLGLFVFSIIFGFLFPVFFAEFIRKFVEELSKRTEGMGFFQLFAFIFDNNLETAFLGLAFGLFFGIIPIIITFFNGYVLGFISNAVASSQGYSVLLRLLPHGIFEIPALILSLGLGLKLGISFLVNFVKFYKKKMNIYLMIVLLILFPLVFFVVSFILSLVRKELRKKLGFDLKNILWIFVYVIIPLLFIAAIIEAGMIVLLK